MSLLINLVITILNKWLIHQPLYILDPSVHMLEKDNHTVLWNKQISSFGYFVIRKNKTLGKKNQRFWQKGISLPNLVKKEKPLEIESVSFVLQAVDKMYIF